MKLNKEKPDYGNIEDHRAHDLAFLRSVGGRVILQERYKRIKDFADSMYKKMITEKAKNGGRGLK